MFMDLSTEPITGSDKQQFCVEMMKRLDIQRRTEQFCDVILEVGSGDDLARLKAHRVALCAASPFFNKALNSDMKEKKEGVIRLEETSKAVMEEVLEYLYTGHVDINENSANFDLIAAADYFVMPSLKALCGKIILKTLALCNCVSIYYFALKYRCGELLKGAKDFILANFVAVAETEDFLNLSSKQVEEWISSDEIIVEGEEEVFEVVVKWMERNECQKQDFYELFRHIRCIYLPRVYLSNVALHDPLIKNNTDCSNCAQDAMKEVFDGEEECYFAQSPRNCLKTHENAIVACGKNSTLCYIPSEDKWYKLSRMLSTRSFFSQAISVCQGKLFFIGDNSDGHPAERYDPSINTWSPLESFKQTVKWCTVVTFQGLLYVMGGVGQEENNRLSTVQRYNPDTNLWQVVSSLSSPRSSVCAVATGSHLYAIGGKSDVGGVNIVERFDPKEKAWCLVAPILEYRSGACGVAVNEKIFVFGGQWRANYLHSNFCEMYDAVTDMWSIVANTVTRPRGKLSAASFKGNVVLCGEFEEDDFQESMSLQIYNIVTSEWKFCTKLPLSGERFKISCLRIPREVLDKCEVLS